MKQSHPVRNILWGIGTICFVALCVLIVWHVTRLEAFTLTDVRVDGGETIDHQVVESLVEAKLEGDYLGLVPRRFSWTYPKSDIVVALDEVERLYNLSLTRDGRTLAVEFDEYKPYALWCESTGERCMFMTDTGYAFAPAPELFGGTFVRYLTPGVEFTQDTQAVSETAFQQLTQLLQGLKEIGWFVQRVELDKADDAFLTLARGGELKTTLKQSPEQTVENLRVVLSSDDFSTIEPGEFKYIDLRFGDKVFVNEFGDPSELATSTASSTE